MDVLYKEIALQGVSTRGRDLKGSAWVHHSGREEKGHDEAIKEEEDGKGRSLQEEQGMTEEGIKDEASGYCSDSEHRQAQELPQGKPSSHGDKAQSCTF